MSFHAVLVTAGIALVVGFRLLIAGAQFTAKNNLGIIPGKWQLWMLGQPCHGKAPQVDNTVI
ncbi:MAG: hypothetical protein ACR2IV_22145 [Bryobacteraceae bacterium]